MDEGALRKLVSPRGGWAGARSGLGTAFARLWRLPRGRVGACEPCGAPVPVPRHGRGGGGSPRRGQSGQPGWLQGLSGSAGLSAPPRVLELPLPLGLGGGEWGRWQGAGAVRGGFPGKQHLEGPDLAWVRALDTGEHPSCPSDSRDSGRAALATLGPLLAPALRL